MALDGATPKPDKPTGPHEHCEQLKLRYQALKSSSERANCESHWEDLAQYVSPRKMGFTGDRTPGEKKMQRVFDPTGILANEMLAAGLHGMATNPATKWFSLRLVTKKIPVQNGAPIDLTEVPEVNQYLAEVEEAMWSRIYQPGTNFTTAVHECYLDLGSFGTAVMFVGQRDDGGLLFECRPLAECVIAENIDGRVDTIYRHTEYTVRQLWQLSRTQGWKLSDQVKDLIKDNKLDDKIKVIHAVYPREERDTTKEDPDNMRWASCYFELETCNELKMGGFPEFPFLVPRWGKYAGEIYGRSPAMTALPDIKMLQQMGLAYIKIVQKAADPPTWLRDDGIIGPQRNVPGGVNYWRGNPNEGIMMQPVSLQGINALSEYIQVIRQQVLQTFYADLMRMVDRADMTATEVVQRTSEQMRLLGPLEGRLQSEFLGPFIERVFGILTRMGTLPMPPEVIQGQDFTIEYISPLATAQKQQSVSGLMQVSMVLANMVGPELAAQAIQKRVNIDKAVEILWDLFNNDPDMLQDEEAMEAASQETQMMKTLMAGQPAADIAQKGAGAIKSVSDAVANSGMDVGRVVNEVGKALSSDPRAQTEMQALANGRAPPPPEG